VLVVDILCQHGVKYFQFHPIVWRSRHCFRCLSSAAGGCWDWRKWTRKRTAKTVGDVTTNLIYLTANVVPFSVYVCVCLQC